MPLVDGNTNMSCIKNMKSFVTWANKYIKVMFNEEPNNDVKIEFIQRWNTLSPCVTQLMAFMNSNTSLDQQQIKMINNVIEVFDQFQYMKELYEDEHNGKNKNTNIRIQSSRAQTQINTDIRKKLEACQNFVAEHLNSSSSLGKRERNSQQVSSGGSKRGSRGKSPYKKTARKFTDSKGKKCTIYTKSGKEYIKKLSKSTGKFVYRYIKA